MIEWTFDADRWNAWMLEAGASGVYTTSEWARLWAEWELGKPTCVRFKSSEGTVLYPFLLVPLDRMEGGGGHHDIRAPYDFGGPLALGAEPGRLLRDFDAPFCELLHQWRVVTEFARLHPYREGQPASATLHATHHAFDFSQPERKSESARSHRSKARAALRRGVEICVEQDPGAETVSAFFELYVETMERTEASAYFFFPRDVIERLMRLDSTVLLSAKLAGKVIAAAIFLREATTLFYFLGASDAASLHVRPNNALMQEALTYAASQGFSRVHFGGGGPTLSAFKERIGNVTVPYFLIRRVHDANAFERLGGKLAGWFPPWFPTLHGQSFSAPGESIRA